MSDCERLQQVGAGDISVGDFIELNNHTAVQICKQTGKLCEC